MAVRCPAGLSVGGRTLWRAVCDAHDLDAPQLAQLIEACRAKDRLDRLDSLLRGELDSWMSIRDFDDGRPFELVISAALTQANATANLMKQLLAALRLPDEVSGRRPQTRPARGAVLPQVPGGAGSVKDRLRAVSP